MIKHAMAALGLTLAAAVAHADGDYLSPTDDRFRVSLGAMRVSSSTTLQVDSSTGVAGTVVSGEDQFGLDSSDWEPRFEVMVRSGHRDRIWLDYFHLDRSGSAVATQPIVFRDVVLQPDEPLQSELDLRMLGLTYGYSFWHGEKVELAATIGVTAVQLAAQVKVATAAVHLNQSEDLAGPFPTPGLAATWVLAKHFYLDGRIEYLNLHVQKFDGSLGKGSIDALYRLTPNVSFALGYTQVRAYLTSTKTHESGLFDFNTKGPELFVRVAF